MEEMQPGQVISPAAASQPTSATPASGGGTSSESVTNPADQAHLSADAVPHREVVISLAHDASTPAGASPKAAAEPNLSLAQTTPSPQTAPDNLPPPSVTEPKTSPPAVALPLPPVPSPVLQQHARAAEDQPIAAGYNHNDNDTGLTWQATEYLAYKKDSTWYGAYTLGAIVLSAVVFLVSRDIISTVVVLLAVIGLVFFASRPPRQLEYSLQDGVLYVGQKPYALANFKSFSVDEQPDVSGLSFLPLKRFAPPLTVYVTSAMLDTVVDEVSAYLPLEPHVPDAMDTLLKRLRF